MYLSVTFSPFTALEIFLLTVRSLTFASKISPCKMRIYVAKILPWLLSNFLNNDFREFEWRHKNKDSNICHLVVFSAFVWYYFKHNDTVLIFSSIILTSENYNTLKVNIWNFIFIDDYTCSTINQIIEIFYNLFRSQLMERNYSAAFSLCRKFT